LKTLPAGSTISYGGGTALDLANFDEFVIPEPNIRFSTAEKTAIMQFVQHGGGLFLIVDIPAVTETTTAGTRWRSSTICSPATGSTTPTRSGSASTR
jgi:hypothetical protein